VVVLTSVSTYILFLLFSLLVFDVNGQTSLIFVLLCDLLYSYVLLIHLIHHLFWFSMYQSILHKAEDLRSQGNHAFHRTLPSTGLFITVKALTKQFWWSALVLRRTSLRNFVNTKFTTKWILSVCIVIQTRTGSSEIPPTISMHSTHLTQKTKLGEGKHNIYLPPLFTRHMSV
jgi:hypothetical protein